jgi:hypothetical protein
MQEPDIARKCAVGLVVLTLLVCVSVLGSWWLASSDAAVESVPAVALAAPLAATPAAAPVALAWRPGAAPAAVPERDGHERRAFQLEVENARLRGRLDDMLNWIIDNVRGTFPLPESQMANLRVVPVDPDLAVSDDLIQLLRLNDGEVDRLDTAFMGTRSVLQELEVEKITVDQPAENQVLLTIPPYAEEGQLVRDELYGEIRRTLGAARYQRFLQVAEKGLDEKFEYFGDLDRTLHFEAVLDAVSGLAQLFVRDERVIPNKDDPLRLDIIASERVVTELPPEYDLYRSWLPEVVTRFARNN